MDASDCGPACLQMIPQSLLFYTILTIFHARFQLFYCLINKERTKNVTMMKVNKMFLHQIFQPTNNCTTMKKTTIILLCCMLTAVFSACQNDDGREKPAPIPDREGLLIDGGRISKVGLYCLEHNPVYDAWFNYYPKVKTLNDYSDIASFCLWLHDERWVYTTDDLGEMIAITTLEEDYFKKKSSFILDAYRQYDASDFRREASRNDDRKHLWGWPDFFTAYTNGEVTITCDKTLFGEAPGANLTKHFVIYESSGCMPVGVENPELRYTFFDDQPTLMSERFPVGVWLQPQYALHFQTVPEEKYDSITLSLTMPLIIEHTREYAVETYKGKNPTPKFTEEVFTAECPIKFNL
jgi:hypothetical protein